MEKKSIDLLELLCKLIIEKERIESLELINEILVEKVAEKVSSSRAESE